MVSPTPRSALLPEQAPPTPEGFAAHRLPANSCSSDRAQDVSGRGLPEIQHGLRAGAAGPGEDGLGLRPRVLGCL